MPYKILEHTSDLYIQGEGKTLEEAVESVADGMFHNMGGAEGEKEKITVKGKGHDMETLLVEFLSNVVSGCEIHSLVPKKLKIIKLDREKLRIEAEVYGEKGVLGNIIKAVTYGLFELKEKKGKAILKVLFDI